MSISIQQMVDAVRKEFRLVFEQISGSSILCSGTYNIKYSMTNLYLQIFGLAENYKEYGYLNAQMTKLWLSMGVNVSQVNAMKHRPN